MNQMYIPKLTKINKIIIITSVVIFVLNALISVKHILGLTPAYLLNGMIHQLVTYPFVNAAPFNLIFDLMVVWFIGSDLESKWGEKTYITFFLTSVIGAGIIYSLYSLFIYGSNPIFNIQMMGLSGFCYALLLAYGIIYSDRVLSFMMLFPVQAKYFVWLMAGMQFLLMLFSDYRATAFGHLSAMGCGFLFLRLKSMASLKAKSDAKIFEMQRKDRVEKAKGRLYVVSDDEENKKKNDPKYWQ